MSKNRTYSYIGIIKNVDPVDLFHVNWPVEHDFPLLLIVLHFAEFRCIFVSYFKKPELFHICTEILPVVVYVPRSVVGNVSDCRYVSDPVQARSQTFVEIEHELINTAILPLPLIQDGLSGIQTNLFSLGASWAPWGRPQN